MKKNIFIIGSGAREHVIGWKLKESSEVGMLYFAPGNGGTRSIGENVAIAMDDIQGLLSFVKTHDIDLTVVGSEAPLALGIVDAFTKEGLRIFGPTKKAAQLEASKAWACEFMKRHDLPTPRFEIFDNASKAFEYASSLGGNCVVKADGLCQGKGVIVCSSLNEAREAIEALMTKKIFGQPGAKVVIQEKLIGKEVSIMAFCDGVRAVPLIAAQDYKRIFDGDHGLNTGGMGAVAPANRVPVTVFKKIHRLLTLAVDAMREEGTPYQGILYAGIMVTADDAYIIEFNSRFGDPETQVQLPLLSSDLLTIIDACVDGTLKSALVEWHPSVCVCIVLASDGYPGAYVSGKSIKGADTNSAKDIWVFHAGTRFDEGHTQTHGGRVLSVVSIGPTVKEAREKVYRYIESFISFEGMHYRKDIGM